MHFEVSDTPPDVVEVVEPNSNSFKDHLQARTEKDVEVFDQVKIVHCSFIFWPSNRYIRDVFVIILNIIAFVSIINKGETEHGQSA